MIVSPMESDPAGRPARSRSGFVRVLSAIRPLQWAKNLLVFVPIVLAHEIGDPEKLARAVGVFAAFSLIASAGYLLNDVRDREFDRTHPVKRRRAIASGELGPGLALGMGTVLLVAAMGIAIALGPRIVGWIGGYALLTAGYTFVLKRIAILDVVALAGAYAMRLLAGGAASSTEVSEWLLAFSIFVFLSLALAKRYGDVQRRVSEGVSRLAGRAYEAGDLVFLQTAGIASAYLSVLVFALYLNSEIVRQLYGAPALLWLICPILLYWTTRIWLLAHRGEMDEDPILFAVRDPISYLSAALIALVFTVAT
jgi:4-hydroxybenzoate polyprenyltransferase